MVYSPWGHTGSETTDRLTLWIFPPSLSPWQYLIYSLPYGFAYSGHFILMELFNTQPFVSSFLNIMFPRSKFRKPVLHSFLWLKNILLHAYFLYPFIWWRFVFIFWLLWITFLWTSMQNFYVDSVFSCLLDIYLGVDLLGHEESLYLTLWRTAKLYPKQLCHFTFPPAMCECSYFFTSFTCFIVHLFAYRHLSGMK